MERDKSKHNFSRREYVERTSRNYRGNRSRGFRPRGRPAYRRYLNEITRSSFNWERAQSPVEGSEEFMNRKIRNTSAIIMRHLLDANDSCPVSTKTNNSTEDKSKSTQIDTDGKNISSSKRANSGKPPSKTKKTANENLTAEQIYEKILNHITNLNDGRKKTFIHTNNSSGLNQAVTDIQKQNRLEISRILRDMSSVNDSRSSEPYTSIVPDIGVKIDELPENVIEELKRSLNIDLLNLNEAQPTATNPSCSVRPSLDATSSAIANSPLSIPDDANAAVHSVQIKQECVDEEVAAIVSSNPFDVEAPRSHQISQSQPYELMENRRSPENRNFEVEIKVEEQCDLVNTPLDIKDESQVIDDNSMLEANSLDIVDELLNEISEGDVNNPDIREPDAVTTNSPAVVPSGLVTDNEESNDVLRDLENTIVQMLASDRIEKCTDVDKVVDKMQLIEGCIQHLTSYRRYLLHLCKRNHSTSHNHVASQTFNDNSPSYTPTPSLTPPAAAASASVNEADKRITKRRKTTSEAQSSGIVLDMDIETDVKSEKLPESPIHLSLEHKILCMEKVDENYLMLGTDAGNIIYVRLHDSCVEYTLDVTKAPITSMQFVKSLNNFMYMYVGCLEQCLRICDFRRKKVIDTWPVCDEITCMDYMWDYLFMGCKNGSLIRFACKKFRVEFEEKKMGSDVLVVKAAQEGPRRILLVGHRNAPIYVRDAMSGLCLRSFSNEAITPTVYSIVINGSSLYCGTAKDNILVFSFHEGRLINSIITDRAKGISCMKIKDNKLYVGCYNGSIYIYELNGTELITVLSGAGGSIQSMEILDTQIVVSTLTGKFASLCWLSKTT